MRKGFTLIELLVFVAIFTLVIGSFIAILISVINIQTRQVGMSEVEQQGQFLTQQIQYYVQSARLVDMPLDSTMSTLTLRESTSSLDPTVLTLSGATVYLSQGLGGALQPLTSNKVQISNLSFTRHYNLNSTSSPFGTDSVSYSFTVSNGSQIGGGYLYSRAITVTSTTTIASGTNTNFPMLFSGTYSWLEASSTGGGAGRIQHLTTAPNGTQEPADLVFAASPANCGISNFGFEAQSYNSSTGAISDWVNVPSLSAGTVIYACYGNGTVATDQSRPSSTWNSNYAGVWHISEGASSTAYDSTVHLNTGTWSGSGGGSISTYYSSGNIGTYAGYFNGSNNHVATNLDIQPSAIPTMTFSAWIYPESTSGNEDVFTDDDGGFDRGLEASRNDGNFNVFTGNGTWTPTSPSLNQWQYVSLTYTPSDILFYKNGVKYDLGGAPTGQASNNKLWIGASPGYGEYFNGLIDEARVSSVALSPSWILTEYNNQSSPSTFYSVGPESTYANSVASQSSEIFQSSVTVLAPVPKIALIQQVKGENNSASVSSIVTAYPSSNETGDLLIAVVANNGLVTSSIADTNGNTWTLLASTTYSSYSKKLALYAALNAASGPNTTTVTFASGASYGSVFLYEYRGAATTSSFDTWAAQNQANTSTPSSGLVYPIPGVELLFGVDDNANTNEVPTPGAGYILETSSTANNTTQVFAENQDTYISGSVFAGWNYTGTPSSTVMIATFK